MRDSHLADSRSSLRANAMRGVSDVGHATLINQLLDEADHAEVVAAELAALEEARRLYCRGAVNE